MAMVMFLPDKGSEHRVQVGLAPTGASLGGSF